MKTCQEWSLEFDLLYNNIVSDKAPGLNEYEKSVFLTRAQEEVITELYKGSTGESFEETELLVSALDSLVKQADCKQTEGDGDIIKISPDSLVFRNPADMWLRTVETCLINTGCDNDYVSVVPVTQDEYWRTIGDPFKGANNRRVLRLSYSTISEKNGEGYSKEKYSEIISKYPVVRYGVRYIAQPEPIILEDLEDGLSINGKSEKQTCKLPEELHYAILKAAVSLAKAVWSA